MVPASEATTADFKRWYEQAYRTIERECTALGHPLGFNPPLLNSVESLTATPRLLVATLNPAGSIDFPDHRGLYRYEGQNAYLDVDWIGHGVGRAPLQQQMQSVFAKLRSRIYGESADAVTFARSRVVTVQLIPFRSPSEDSLHSRDESVRVSRSVWNELFQLWVPSAAVTIGSTTADELGVLLGNVERERALPTGWGNYRMTLRQYSCGTRMLGLPHLSRFAIFGRPQSEPYLDEAFDWLAGKFA